MRPSPTPIPSTFHSPQTLSPRSPDFPAPPPPQPARPALSPGVDSSGPSPPWSHKLFLLCPLLTLHTSSGALTCYTRKNLLPLKVEVILPPPPNAPARSLGEGVPLTPVASWKLTRSEQNGEPIVQPQHHVGEATKDVSSSETKESMTARQEVSCGVCSAPASACRCH